MRRFVYLALAWWSALGFAYAVWLRRQLRDSWPATGTLVAERTSSRVSDLATLVGVLLLVLIVAILPPALAALLWKHHPRPGP